MLLIVIVVILCIVAGIGTVIAVTVRRDEKRNYYVAARNIFREDRLNDNLKRVPDRSNGYDAYLPRPMIYLKFRTKRKGKYVFDPGKIINIGRDSASNQICIDDASVSFNHCRIFSSGNDVWIEDMNSSNGTVVRRGKDAYKLTGGQSMMITTMDIITIGTTEIAVTVFLFDPASS